MKKITVIMLAVFMIFGFSTAASAAPVLTFDIQFDGMSYTGSTYDLMLGDTVDVDILFSVTEESVISGAFNLTFDSSLLTASNLGAGAGWTMMATSGISPGSAKYDALSFTPVGPGTDYLFASFDLTCLDPGLSKLYLLDLDDRSNWVTASGVVLDDQMPGLIANVNNVPIPGALWLLGSGLVGLVGLRRRMK